MSENNNSVWLIACRPSGIIAILLAFGVAILLSNNASAANLMLNGDFETGDFTNWTHAVYTVSSADARSGTYSAYYDVYVNTGGSGGSEDNTYFYQSIDLTGVDLITFYYKHNVTFVGGAGLASHIYCDIDRDNSYEWKVSTDVESYTYAEVDTSGISGVHDVEFGGYFGFNCAEFYIDCRFDDIIAEGAEPEINSIVFNPNVSISNQTQQYFDYNVNSTWNGYMYFVTSVWHAPYELPDLRLIENWLNVEQEGENVPLNNPFNDLQTYHLNLYATSSAPPVVSESFLIASSNDIYINRSYTGSIPSIPDPEPEPDPYEPDPNPIEDPNTTIPDDWNMTIPDKYQNVSWLTNYTGYFDDSTSSVNNTLYSVTGLVIKPMQSLNETVHSLRYHISNSKNMVAEYSYLSVIVYYGWGVLPVEMQTICIGFAAAGACIYLFKRRT